MQRLRRQPFLSGTAALVEFEIAEPGMVGKLAGATISARRGIPDLHTDHIADFFRRGNFRLLDKLALDLIDRHVCRHGQHKGGRLQQFCVMDIGLPDTVTQMQRQIDGSGDSTVCSARLTSGNSVLNVLVRS